MMNEADNSSKSKIDPLLYENLTDMPRCKTCHWWNRAIDNREMGGLSQCRGAPPISGEEDNQYRRWPQVTATDWCGMHKTINE